MEEYSVIYASTDKDRNFHLFNAYHKSSPYKPIIIRYFYNQNRFECVDYPYAIIVSEVKSVIKKYMDVESLN